MKLITSEKEDSMSLNDIKYLKDIIKTRKDDYPLIHFYNILKENNIFSIWNKKTNNIPILINTKDQYNTDGITFNGALNVYIKKHSDNKYKKLKGELLKLMQIVQQKNNYRHMDELNNVLIQKFINKELNSFEFVVQTEKIKFEGLIYTMYFTLLIVINYLDSNISKEDKEKLITFFMKRYQSVITSIKSYLNINKLDLYNTLKFLENILTDNQLFLKIFALFIERQVDKEYFQDEMRKLSSLV
jgi:hypothetical protein